MITPQKLIVALLTALAIYAIAYSVFMLGYFAADQLKALAL